MIPRLARPTVLIRRTEALARSIKLVVDPSSARDDPALEELMGCARLKPVELWSTAAPSARWLSVGAYDRSEDSVEFRFNQPGSQGYSTAPRVSFLLAEIPRLQARGFPAPENDLERALCLFAAAQSFGADAIIVGGWLLRLRDWALQGLSGMSIVSADEALGLIGLKLRTRRMFDIPLAPAGTFTIDRGSFYWVATRDALPAGWGWHSAAIGVSQSPPLSSQTSAVLTRFCHALRARDACQTHLQLRERPDFDELLYHLDALFLSLAGACDGAAHVASRVYGLPSAGGAVGWRRKEWMKALARAAPKLAGVVAEGTPGRDVLTCLYELRNLIHVDVLGRVTHSSGSKRQDFLAIPNLGRKGGRTLPELLTEATDRLGGHALWGLRADGGSGVVIEPDRYIEELFAHCLALLNQLMETTEVSRLVPAGSQSHQSPQRAWYAIEPVHKTIALLSALGAPPTVRITV